MTLHSLLTAAAWAVAIAGAGVTGYVGTMLATGSLTGPALWRPWARLARRVPLLAPHQGRHLAPAPGRYGLPARAPAPGLDRAQGTPRPADPPSGSGAVRAGATTTPGAAIAAGGTRQAPATPRPEAAPWPGADAAPDPAPPSPGPGQPVTWHRPDGTRVIIGYGPTAEIRNPYAQNRVTGAHAVIPGTRPLVPRGYAAFEARRDAAVNL